MSNPPSYRVQSWPWGVGIGVWWYTWGAYGFWWGLLYGIFWPVWVGYRFAEWLMR